MRNITFILGIVLGLGIALFALQNGMPVSVRFLAWQVDGPLAGVVLGSAAAGVLIAVFFGIPQFLTARWKIRALEQENAALRSTSAPPAAPKPTPPAPPPPPKL